MQNTTGTEVDACANFWGAADGPSGAGSGSGDAVSPLVNACDIRPEPMAVVVATVDTVVVRNDEAAVVEVFLRNWANPTDQLTVTATDELGWLSAGSPQSLNVMLPDSLAGVAELAVLAPAGTPEGALNTVTLDAVSTTDPSQSASASIILVADDPTVNTAIEEEAAPAERAPIVEMFALSGAYPNPFNPSTQFTLQVREPQQVRIAVYDVLGRRVRQLFDGPVAGQQVQRYVFEAADLSSGVYLIHVQGEYFLETRQVLLLK